MFVLFVLCVYDASDVSHPAVPPLSRMRNQDGPLQFSRTQYGPPLTQSKDGVPALQRWFGEETCSRELRNFTCCLCHVLTLFPLLGYTCYADIAALYQ